MTNSWILNKTALYGHTTSENHNLQYVLKFDVLFTSWLNHHDKHELKLADIQVTEE